MKLLSKCKNRRFLFFHFFWQCWCKKISGFLFRQKFKNFRLIELIIFYKKREGKEIAFWTSRIDILYYIIQLMDYARMTLLSPVQVYIVQSRAGHWAVGSSVEWFCNFFPIFEKRRISAKRVYFYESNSKDRHIRARTRTSYARQGFNFLKIVGTLKINIFWNLQKSS